MRTNPESGALGRERLGPVVAEILAAAAAARRQRTGAPEAAGRARRRLALHVVVEPVGVEVRRQRRHLRLQLAGLWRRGGQPGQSGAATTVPVRRGAGETTCGRRRSTHLTSTVAGMSQRATRLANAVIIRVSGELLFIYMYIYVWLLSVVSPSPLIKCLTRVEPPTIYITYTRAQTHPTIPNHTIHSPTPGSAAAPPPPPAVCDTCCQWVPREPLHPPVRPAVRRRRSAAPTSVSWCSGVSARWPAGGCRSRWRRWCCSRSSCTRSERLAERTGGGGPEPDGGLWPTGARTEVSAGRHTRRQAGGGRHRKLPSCVAVNRIAPVLHYDHG